MNKITILGHTNQDTDATVAAICLAQLFNKTKEYIAQAKISDSPNKETEYVLKKFKTEKPKSIKTNKKGEKVFLIDFNEESQSPVDFNKVEIEGLIDHHKLDICFKKDYPVLFRVEPLGASSSIIAKMYFEKEVKMTKKIAGLLLCGIVSDTLKFSSPTSTKEDEKIAKKLAMIAKEDIDLLADKMFEAKSDISGIKTKDLIIVDYKNFDFSGKKTGIGVFETVNPKPILDIEEEIRNELKDYKKKEKLDLIFFAVVDILNNKTTMIVIGDEEEKALIKVFPEFDLKNDSMQMPGVVSRKKQIVPEFMNKLK